MKKAAIGFRVHSGWTALVAVSLDDGRPIVLSRQRVHLVKIFSYTFRQPFHTAAKMEREDANRFVEQVKGEAQDLAYRGISSVQAELRELGYRVDWGALLLASGRPLPELEKILLSHALIHTADGELFREAVRAAILRCSLRLACIRVKDLLKECAETFSSKSASVLKQVTELGKGIGPPWSQDEKFATLAAWLSLAVPKTAKRDRSALLPVGRKSHSDRS